LKEVRLSIGSLSLHRLPTPVIRNRTAKRRINVASLNVGITARDLAVGKVESEQ
jgi:hypothetical protein